MAREDVPLGVYEHYKNKQLYEVIGTALHTETREEMVVYKALYDNSDFPLNQMWVRPKAMFLERVIHDGYHVLRFKRVAA